MVYFVTAFFMLIVELPSCEEVMENILSQLTWFSPVFLIFLAIITLVNIFIEKILEKRKSSKEFLKLLFLHTLLYIVTFIINAIILYFKCC